MPSAGGETTVTLTDVPGHGSGGVSGRGGRNQELALAFALKLRDLRRRPRPRRPGRKDDNNASHPDDLFYDVVLASVGTDGTDGPTDAAGAVVDGGTVDRIEAVHDRNCQRRRRRIPATTKVEGVEGEEERKEGLRSSSTVTNSSKNVYAS